MATDPEVLLRATRRLAALLLVVSVAACSWFSGSDPQTAVATQRRPTAPAVPTQVATPSDVLLFVADGGMGRAELYDDRFGGWVKVSVIGEYQSASGKLCRRFTVQSAVGATANLHYACRSSNGQWSLINI